MKKNIKIFDKSLITHSFNSRNILRAARIVILTSSRDAEKSIVLKSFDDGNTCGNHYFGFLYIIFMFYILNNSKTSGSITGAVVIWILSN